MKLSFAQGDVTIENWISPRLTEKDRGHKEKVIVLLCLYILSLSKYVLSAYYTLGTTL